MIGLAIITGITGALMGAAVTAIVQHRYYLTLERALVSRIIEKAGVRPLDAPAPVVQEAAPRKPAVMQKLSFKV